MRSADVVDFHRCWTRWDEVEVNHDTGKIGERYRGDDPNALIIAFRPKYEVRYALGPRPTRPKCIVSAELLAGAGPSAIDHELEL